jgi:hypothetical protein
MNYKIHAGSNTDLIQQRLFDHGYKWMNEDKNIEKDAIYLCIESDDIAMFQFLDDFIESKCKELTLTEFFKMFPEKSLSDKIREKLAGKVDVITIAEICEMIEDVMKK